MRVGWFRASAIFQVVSLGVTLWSTKVHLGDNFRFLNLVLRLVKSNSCVTEVSNTVFSTFKMCHEHRIVAAVWLQRNSWSVFLHEQSKERRPQTMQRFAWTLKVTGNTKLCSPTCHCMFFRATVHRWCKTILQSGLCSWDLMCLLECFCFLFVYPNNSVW